MKMINQQMPKNLDELFKSIKKGEIELSPQLPVFGGSEPESTSGVWSWDETRLLVGTCASDLRMERRS
jgi:hypothetical protein